MDNQTKTPAALREECRTTRADVEVIASEAVADFPYGGQEKQMRSLLLLAKTTELLEVIRLVDAAAFLQTEEAGELLHRVGALSILLGRVPEYARLGDLSMITLFAADYLHNIPKVWYLRHKLVEFIGNLRDPDKCHNVHRLLSSSYVPTDDASQARREFEALERTAGQSVFQGCQFVPKGAEQQAASLALEAFTRYVGAKIAQCDALTRYHADSLSGREDVMHIRRSGMLVATAGKSAVSLVESHTISDETACRFAAVYASVELSRLQSFVGKLDSLCRRETLS